MLRPVRFGFNEQTASSNSFQIKQEQSAEIQKKALAEFDQMVDLLRQNKVNVMVIDDTLNPHTPDSVFPNNWISFHEDGRVALYPMEAENRRVERRMDILEQLKERFELKAIEDYTMGENRGQFLEGTGSMVLDRENRICYACLSPRTNLNLLQTFCLDFNYQLIYFEAFDKNNKPIYHTNVLMCVGSTFMLVCLDCISNQTQREQILQSNKKELITISLEQVAHFAGNMLELRAEDGEKLLIMSQQAYQSLQAEQVATLQKYCRILSADLQTIESNGGGSARCMIAEVFLPQK